LCEQQRAREVVEWRCYVEEQAQLEAEQQQIAVRQQEHQERYQEQKRTYAHLSWRQKKVEIYRTNKLAAAMRPSEKTQPDHLALPLVLKGRPGP